MSIDSNNNKWIFRGNDLRSSLVVFLVALPLCLGIALASNAPLSAGIISGILGGIVVGFLGGSPVSVSGPAAGLTVIVFGAIAELGSFQVFTSAVVLCGVIQLAMGVLRAGELGNFFPTSVIKGMLAAIGITLILKQVPHAVGWDSDFMGDSSFGSVEGQNTFSDLINSLGAIHLGALTISLTSLGIMLCWDKVLSKKIPFLKNIPSALVAVCIAVFLNNIIFVHNSNLILGAEHLVNLPFEGGLQSFINAISFPDINAFGKLSTWKVAITLAIVASIETLLSLDAADKIDPLHRTSHKNKELRAQGVGNIICGILGALPMTAVIVRTSANVASGGTSRISAILHGAWLLLAVILFPSLLTKIPLSVLASILILVGWKLTSLDVIRQQIKYGKEQFIPFAVTIVAIVFTDLLVGIAIGLVVGLFSVIKTNYHSSVVKMELDENILIRFSKDVSFLHKSIVRLMFRELPDGSKVILDGSRSVYVDYDILDLIQEFLASAPNRDIQVTLKKSRLALCDLFKEES